MVVVLALLERCAGRKEMNKSQSPVEATFSAHRQSSLSESATTQDLVNKLAPIITLEAIENSLKPPVNRTLFATGANHVWR